MQNLDRAKGRGLFKVDLINEKKLDNIQTTIKGWPLFHAILSFGNRDRKTYGLDKGWRI